MWADRRFTLIWDVAATITTAIIPRGDYTKARRALEPATPRSA